MSRRIHHRPRSHARRNPFGLDLSSIAVGAGLGILGYRWWTNRQAAQALAASNAADAQAAAAAPAPAAPALPAPAAAPAADAQTDAQLDAKVGITSRAVANTLMPTMIAVLRAAGLSDARITTWLLGIGASQANVTQLLTDPAAGTANAAPAATPAPAGYLGYTAPSGCGCH